MATLPTRLQAQASAITTSTLIHIVVTGDTSQSPQGSSYKATLGQLQSLFGGNTDLYITGGTYSAGTLTLTNLTGGTIVISGFYTDQDDVYVTGSTLTVADNNTNTQSSELIYHGTPIGGPYFIDTENTFITGGTYDNNTALITFSKNDGTTFTVDLSSIDVNDTYVTGGTNNQSTDNTNVASIDLLYNQDVSPGTYNLPYTDTFVTGGTYDNNTALITFDRNDGNSFTVDLSSIDVNDTYITGGTYSSGTLDLFDNSGNTITITGFTLPFTGGTVTGETIFTGGISATTISATTIGSPTDCVDDLYVSNIHSCSPLNINPLDEGNVYFGSTSGITIDVTNSRLGIGVDSPTYPIEVLGNNSIFWYDPTSVGGNLIVSGNTGLPRFGGANAPYLTKVSTGWSMGMRCWDDVTYPGYGKVGDMHIYAGTATNGVNIINAPGIGTDDYVRFYAGQTATGTADIHVQGSGSTKSYVGIGIETPTEKLDVNGNTKIRGSLNIGNILSGTPIGNLGFDSSGNVVTGVTTILPQDVFVYSGNANVSNSTLTFLNTTGGTFTVTNSAALFADNDINVTGGTYNPTTGCVTFTTNSGTTFDVCGFLTGFTDTYVTGGTYSTGTATFTNNLGGTFNVTGFTNGSGTLNYVSKWTPDGNTLGDSIIQDDGTNVGIGTAPSVNARLAVGTSTQFYALSTLNQANNGIGVIGQAINGTGTNYGVYGLSNSSVGTNNVGVYGDAKLGVNNYCFQGKDGTEGIGKVLTSVTADGKAQWGSLSSLYTGNTSGDCINDIYVKNIHSCSPLNINPLDEGNVYFGSTSGITIDPLNNYVGIGTYSASTPTANLDIRGNIGSRIITSTVGTGAVSNTSRFNIYNNNISGKNQLLFTKYGGTIDSPTDVTTDGSITLINTSMYKDGGVQQVSGIAMGSINTSSLNYNGYISFTTTSGTTAESRMFINYDGNIGVGTETPSEKLDVSGKTKTINFQMTSGATNGYVLTSDASGNASWQASSGGVSIDPYNNLGNVNTITWNVSGVSTNYQATLTGNTTLALTNVRNGDYGTIIITQDGVGGRTLTFGTVNGGATTHRVANGGGGAPVLTSNPSAIDILTFTYNGSVMYWTVGNDYT